MATLPASGELFYNGVTFNALYESKVTGRPVPDDSGRTNKCIEYTFDVHSTVGGVSGVTDETLEVWRISLQHPGGELRYKDKGFGGFGIGGGGADQQGFIVNDEDGVVRDVMWGPKPKLLEFTPIGDKNAAKVHWQCVVNVPECGELERSHFSESIMAFGYEVTRAHDGDGYETITITGYIEIPLTWNYNDRNVNDSADNYWERIYPQPPDGYKPVRRERKLSQDRRRLDFTIVWEEQPVGGLPRGCVAANGGMRVASSNKGMVVWNGNISASYTVAKDQRKSWAWDAFFALIHDRLTHIRKNSDKTDDGDDTLLLTRFAFDEGLYQTRETSFEVDFVFGSSLNKILLGSGIWRPIPETNAQQWKASVGQFSSAYGGPVSVFRHEDDVIIDLCLAEDADINFGVGAQRPQPAPTKPMVEFGKPGKKHSWIEYVNRIGTRVLSGVVKHKPIPDVVTDIEQQARAGALANLMNKGAVSTEGLVQAIGIIANLQFDQLAAALDNKTEGVTPRGPRDQGDSFEQARNPDMEIVMAGYAVRAGFHIPIPELISISGNVAIPVDQRTNHFTVGNFGGVPLYYASWELVYDMKDLPPPKEIAYPTNPMLNVKG